MASESVEQWDSDKYWVAQDFQTSARLHLQHWIWNYQLGYALHPKVNIDASQPLRVADVAAGNGAWILEVARSSKPNSIELDGFDITSSNFPAAGWLPPNIRLHVWDAFTDVPDQYVDVFDVVHIRAMYSSVVDNKVDPLLSNLLKMLKPGGFLQWDESDASTIQCQVPNPEVKADAARTLVTLQQVFSRGQSRLVPDWIHNLPSTLEGRKCEMVANEEFQPRPELARAWTDNMLLVWRGLIPMIPEASVPLPPGMGSPESISRQSYAELLQKAVEETSKGAAINMIYHVFVARKKA